MEGILLPIYNNSVPGIRTTVESGAHIIVLRKNVYKLSLALITPLRTQYHTELGFGAVEALFT